MTQSTCNIEVKKVLYTCITTIKNTTTLADVKINDL